MAIPFRPHNARSNSIAHIHGFTPKRWIFKQVLRAAVLVGADRFFTSPCADPLREYAGISTSRFLSKVNPAVSNRAMTISLIWPWPPNRYRGRLYVQVFDRLGAPIAFTKIALRADQATKIMAEAEMLQALGTSAGDTMRAPALLASGEIDGKAFIASEPLPARLKAIPCRVPFPEHLFEALAGKKNRLILSELVSLPWWLRFQSCLRSIGGFGSELLDGIGAQGLTVCRVHGDFSSKNIFRNRHGFWIVDWETGAISAPHLVDRICYQLAGLTGARKRDRLGTLETLIGKYGGDRRGRLELAAALGYLMASDSVEAEQLLLCWANFSKGLDRGSFVS